MENWRERDLWRCAGWGGGRVERERVEGKRWRESSQRDVFG